MTGLLRLALLLILAGAAFTALVSLVMWLMNEERRLRRAIVQTLGAEPDAMLIAHGRGQAAGLSMGAGGIAVAWDAGAWRLVYPLEELIGVELIVDDHIVGRAFRDEPRRPLERLPRQADYIALRLVFDDPHHPDFMLELWPAPAEHRRAPQTAGVVMTEANRWLARAEAIMRRTAPQRAPDPRVGPDPPSPAVASATDRRDLRDIPPWEDDDLDIPED